MTKIEFEKMRFYKGKKLYWLGDIEKVVLSVDFDSGQIECSDGDIHHFSDLNNKKAV